MIHDIGDITLDFSKVDFVGRICETENDSRYIVYFGEGNQLEIFHDRKDIPEDINVICMPREEFISLWKQSKNPSCKIGCKKKEKPSIDQLKHSTPFKGDIKKWDTKTDTDEDDIPF